MAGATNIEIVRQMHAAFLAGEADRALAFFHPDVEFDTTVRPDGRIWHGREGVRRALTEWVGAWDEYAMELERCLDAGDDRVVMLWHERGRARASGAPMSQAGVSVFKLRGGVITAASPRIDRRATLSELGLDPAD